MTTVRTKSCEKCDSLFPKDCRISVNAFAKRRFCSRKCAGQVISKGNKPSELNRRMVSLANRGSKSIWWKGGLSSNRKEYFKLKGLERYARLKGAVGSFTVQEWLDLKEKYGNSCAFCKIPESLAKITKDHVIPLTKGGSNFISNIQPLCQSCNSRKHNKLVYNYG